MKWNPIPSGKPDGKFLSRHLAYCTPSIFQASSSPLIMNQTAYLPNYSAPSPALLAPMRSRTGELLINRIQEAIIHHIDDEAFGPFELAKAMGMSRYHLHRLIKSAAGLKTTELMHQVRIKHACSILMSTGYSVKEVAYAVGYSTPSYFTRVFRQVMGVCPQGYLRSAVAE